MMRNALKILIVDDDKASAQMLAEIVKRMGFKPVLSYKPLDALNVVRLQTFHAAIVDVLLPKMSGVDMVAEFRRTKFAKSPVIFVSGVFKDKAFAADTLKKTEAVAFLSKPFETAELTNALQEALRDQMVYEKWTVQSLLTRKLNSDRERAKAVENLEQMKGLDFPFVLSILMEVGSSGHLNIVNDAGEIFGVKLNKGALVDVDSTESQSTVMLALISKGFLSQEDWDEIQKKTGKRPSAEKLVELGYISPHAISEAQRQQIIYDFRAICGGQVLQVNFVPQEDEEEIPKHAVRLEDLMKLLETDDEPYYSEVFLTEFYESVRSNPIKTVAEAEHLAHLFESEPVKAAPGLQDIIENGGTLGQALEAAPNDQFKIYRGLNFLVLNRAILFDDLSRVRSQNANLERYRQLYGELKDRSPDKVFEYFGATAHSSAAAVQTIFDEYARSNSPEQIGKDATPELKDLCKKCFEIVKQACDVMTDETKRQKLFDDMKNQAAERQVRGQKLMNEGLEILRRGQAKEAFAKLKEATALFPSTTLTLISVWAEVKAGAGANKPRLHQLAAVLDQISAEERRSQYYYFALGLVKRGLGDHTAIGHFEKALQMDPEFIEARRELNSMQTQAAQKANESKKLDLFTGDITEIVSQLFKRKAD